MKPVQFLSWQSEEFKIYIFLILLITSVFFIAFAMMNGISRFVLAFYWFPLPAFVALSSRIVD